MVFATQRRKGKHAKGAKAFLAAHWQSQPNGAPRHIPAPAHSTIQSSTIQELLKQRPHHILYPRHLHHLDPHPYRLQALIVLAHENSLEAVFIRL